jgi:hypothetical protein
MVDPLNTDAIRQSVKHSDWRLQESFAWGRATIFDLCDEVDRLTNDNDHMNALLFPAEGQSISEGNQP